MVEIFFTFLRLGVTSFGGPIAHLGFFKEAFVTRRAWLSESAYADLVALSQFLPGPASSQVGFAVGVMRGGLGGGLAAWLGFTLPSAVLMAALALGLTTYGAELPGGLIQGLKLVAVAVVAHAVWTMGGSLAKGQVRASLALLGAGAVLWLPEVLDLARAHAQLLVIAAGAIAGLLLLREKREGDKIEFKGTGKATAGISAALFLVLIFGLPFVASEGGLIALADTMTRAGTLVFGGGHVVLPLLEAEMVPTGYVTGDQFIAGYGAAQAVPGPLFTFSAYLGALFNGGGGQLGLAGAAVALAFIFLPGMLLILAFLPAWGWLRSRAWAAGMLNGVNAAVVGILGAALYDPLMTATITSPLHAFWALAGFAAFAIWRLPVWALVVASGALGAAVL